jgi:glycosyltransferase involved in cell wall biosynthesis
MPKVSIIITNYNHEKYLDKRIQSVLNQTYTDFGVVIYDDCSTDNSKKVIEKYRREAKIERIVYNEKNSGGLFKQWEKGIAEAIGDWIWVAQSDDYADPDLLQELVKLTEKNDNVGIAFCGSHWVNEKGEKGDDLSLYYESFFRNGLVEIRYKLSRQCSVQNASSAIIRRDLAVEAIKGIGAYRACGDWIFYLRILQKANIAYTSTKLNYFRWYHSNVSNTAKDDGTWILEGLDIFKNMDYRKIGFSLKEFYLVLKWWRALISKTTIADKGKMYKVLFQSAGRYIIGAGL